MNVEMHRLFQRYMYTNTDTDTSKRRNGSSFSSSGDCRYPWLSFHHIYRWYRR